jgi:uncharacterized membrane protein YeaQ/YmgE (transglycosylase-associated protein family)
VAVFLAITLMLAWGCLLAWMVTRLRGARAGVGPCIAVGLLGICLAGFLADQLGLIARSSIARLVVGLSGAVLLVWLMQRLRLLRIPRIE